MKTREFLKELQNKNAVECARELEDLRKKFFETRMEGFSGKLKNVKSIARIRQQIAQVKTILTIKEKTDG